MEQELNRLEREGVLKRVNHRQWPAPIVTVPKKDGTVRICGDYKVTVNPVLDVDQYPLPRPEDLFATLAGGKFFSTLDLSHAYNQVVLDDSSLKYLTINTHRGLYQYTRLPFGVASAPSVFRKMMDTILQGMDGVICYLDDIMVSGRTEEEHLTNLRKVLERLQEHGIRAKRAKCTFLKTSVQYLGHVIGADRLHATDAKIEAIVNAPSPKNVPGIVELLWTVHPEFGFTRPPTQQAPSTQHDLAVDQVLSRCFQVYQGEDSFTQCSRSLRCGASTQIGS